MTVFRIGDRVKVTDKSLVTKRHGRNGTVRSVSYDPSWPSANVQFSDGFTQRFNLPDSLELLSTLIDRTTGATEPDKVNHPSHYTQHPSGVECIEITEHMSFVLGNAVKYIWRADLKNGVEDLEKARFYIDREITNRKAGQ